jgi:predicted ATPase/DNA-binding SARP family transcriptional activator
MTEIQGREQGLDPPRVSSVEIYTLGQFKVVVRGRTLENTDWRRTRARQLFKFLITSSRRRVLREEVVELLWPEDDTVGSGSGNLRSTLTAMRKALEPAAVLDADRETLALATGPGVWLDALVFEDLLERARLARDPYPLLVEASGLYAGDYLPEDVFEDWARDRREHLKRTWIDLQFTLARLEVERGAANAAVQVLERLVRADRSDERAAMELMRLRYRLGDRPEALRVYQRLVQALQEDLGVEPSEAVVQLSEQVAAPDTPTQAPNDGAAGQASVLSPWISPEGLPTGLVAFLWSEVVESPRLWEMHPRAMHAVIRRHDELFTEHIRRRAGQLARSDAEGDRRLAVFTRSADAMLAAAEIQAQMLLERWAVPEPLQVRIGLHTGEAHVRDGGYEGQAPYRCASLRSVAHGGQVLLSGAMYDLVCDSPQGWPEGISARFLGEHRLPMQSRPEHVYQLLAPGIASNFPPLANSTIPAQNLPAEVTSFFGREEELQRLEQSLLDPSTRLVTVTGPGGVGKSRLALRAAAQVANQFPDGTYLIPVVEGDRADGLAARIAQVLAIPGVSGPLPDHVVNWLKGQHLLMVLDNFEQGLEVALFVARLLASCAHIKILVTSREILGLSGENAFDLEPLPIPDGSQLLIARAQAARRNLVLDAPAYAAAIEICRRADGLPLAIELVAAHADVLPLTALNANLSKRRLSAEWSGPRDAPERHRTLRQAIAWSYERLNPSDQSALRRLAVFSGGCTLEAAALVCELPDVMQTLGVLTSLVRKSLLRSTESADGDVRFVALDTIREYALEQLELAREADAVRERHAELFLKLLNEAGPGLTRLEQSGQVARVRPDHDNLRTAMRWVLDHGDIEGAQQMASALSMFWLSSGFTHEGQAWLDEVLARSADRAGPLRASVLLGAAWLAYQAGQLQTAQEYAEAARREALETDDLLNAARSSGILVHVLSRRGDYQGAVESAEESLRISQRKGDTSILSRAYTRLAELHAVHCHVEPAIDAATTAITMARRAGDQHSEAAALDALGLAEFLSGQPATAADHLERSVELHLQVGFKNSAAEAYLRWADALIALGRLEGAAKAGRQGLQLAQEAGNPHLMAVGVRVWASIAAAQRQYARAAQLCQGARDLQARNGESFAPAEDRIFSDVLNQIRTYRGGEESGDLVGPAGVSAEALLSEILDVPDQPDDGEYVTGARSEHSAN